MILKKPDKRENINLFFSAFLILAFIVCAHFFTQFTANLEATAATVVNILIYAVFGLLVVYCLKNVSLLDGSRGIPEFAGIAVTALLFRWKQQMILAIAGGTVCYMVLVQMVF